MERECKFRDQGCEFVGTGPAVQAHIERCSYWIECPYWICYEKMAMGKVVGHLKHEHGAKESMADHRRAILVKWIIPQDSILASIYEAKYWPPSIMPNLLDGHTFILHSLLSDSTHSTWVSVLGSKEVSEIYRAKISISYNTSYNTSITNVGPVYSAQISKAGILEDPEGSLLLLSHISW